MIERPQRLRPVTHQLWYNDCRSQNRLTISFRHLGRMPLEELLTRWSVRLSLLLYAATLAAFLIGRTKPALLREARLTWTAGCLLLWLHLAAAFHFYHHWSHEAAWRATARDTEATIGLAFGTGVYFNYVFAVVWTIDAAWWWSTSPRSYYCRPRWAGILVHGFLIFMVINAAVLFADGALRWIAAAMLIALAVLASITRPRQSLPQKKVPDLAMSSR
jgi:hypothetical protein